MTAIRETGKINENTMLIDFGMSGAARTGAVYLIEAGKSCLIDAGRKEGAKRIVRCLRDNHKELPDYVILTHSHYDHCQGVHALRKAAAKANHKMEIMASEPAIPHLEDQSFNKVFYPDEHFENILDVTSLRDGATLDLGGIELEIAYTPGHTNDHISILDEKNKNVFVGCALGSKIADNAFLPPFMPPFWDMDVYQKSVERLGQIEYDTLCLSHFGCIFGDEAHTILEESVSVCKSWWSIFQSVEEQGRLNDVEYLVTRILAETGMGYPDIELLDPKLKYGLKLLNSMRRIRRKEPLLAAEVLMHDTVIPWLTKGYEIYTGA